MRKQENGIVKQSEESMTRMNLSRILPDTFILLPFKFMYVKRTHISASPFPLSAASYPPGPLPAKYFRRL